VIERVTSQVVGNRWATVLARMSAVSIAGGSTSPEVGDGVARVAEPHRLIYPDSGHIPGIQAIESDPEELLESPKRGSPWPS